MITTENSARMYANKLVKQFYEDHKETIETHRDQGNIGEVLGIELDSLRTLYMCHVLYSITSTTEFLNKAILKIIFRSTVTN